MLGGRPSNGGERDGFTKAAIKNYNTFASVFVLAATWEDIR